MYVLYVRVYNVCTFFLKYTVHFFVHTYSTCIHTHIHTCTHIHTYAHIYTHIYTYIYTYIHIQALIPRVLEPAGSSRWRRTALLQRDSSHRSPWCCGHPCAFALPTYIHTCIHWICFIHLCGPPYHGHGLRLEVEPYGAREVPLLQVGLEPVPHDLLVPDRVGYTSPLHTYIHTYSTYTQYSTYIMGIHRCTQNTGVMLP